MVGIGGEWLLSSEFDYQHCSNLHSSTRLGMVLISVAYACHGDVRQDRVRPTRPDSVSARRLRVIIARPATVLIEFTRFVCFSKLDFNLLPRMRR